MDLHSVLITGANRGIGQEFTRQLVGSSRPPKHVFATYRNEDTIQGLKEIQSSASPETKVHLLKMDVLSFSDVEKACVIIEEAVGENGLTLLINNAGVLQRLEYPEVTVENLAYHFRGNVVGPLLLAQKMLPLLKKAVAKKSTSGMSISKAAILNMSSEAGCIAKSDIPPPHGISGPSYKISKAALNMAMRVLSAVVKDDGILIVNMCPGWTKTDMGSDRAELLPHDSVNAMLRTIPTLDETHHGAYMNRFGEPFPW